MVSVLPPLISPPRLAHLYTVCTSLSRYDASHALADPGSAPQPRVIRGDWSLSDDKRSKPGWICTGVSCLNSTLDFEVTFGPSPRLSIVYDRSYEGHGTVRVSMAHHPTTAGKLLLGMYPAGAPRVTQAEVAIISEPWFGMAPHTRQVVRVQAVGEGKFKIRALSSC